MDQIVIAASTHWDREWYRTFQDFQIRLCDLFNELLELLESDEEFCCYTFDGQSVVLEDYLEIYPENRDRIKKQVEAGRLMFGPLYNLPDEFLSGGEGLIRNFLLGDQVCREIGGKLKAGYVPDNFGHISQLPQILQGVGLDSAFFFRGTHMDTVAKKEFWWKSPDGSEVLCEYMLLGYWSLKSWGKLGKSVSEHFHAAYTQLKDASKLNTFLLINGSDHLYQDPEFTKMVKEVKQKYPELEIRNGSIGDYARLAKKAAASVKDLVVVEGELRDFRYGPDPNSAGSCRNRLKKLLFSVMAEIERYAEPLTVMASSADASYQYPAGFFRKVWKNLCIALGHDGISGCSTDQVMEDIRSYIVHAGQIGERISEIALQKLGDKMALPTLADGEQYLSVFNPHPFTYDGITIQTVHMEKEDVIYRDFELYDETGRRISYEIRERKEDIITREFPYNSKKKIGRTCVTILFHASDVPAMGFRVYLVKKKVFFEKREEELYIRLQESVPSIENKRYKITVNRDASLDILDKQNGMMMNGMNTYVSRGEVGDEYQHVSPLLDRHVFARMTGIALLHGSALSQTLRVEAKLQIPKDMTADMLGRSEREEVCCITTDVTLYEHSERIEFTARINNPCADHILYAVFPTAFQNAKEYSYVSFDEVERDTALPSFDASLKSTPSILKPMQKYAGIRGEDGSFHIMTKGLFEYHTKGSENRKSFYLTLLRSSSYLFHGLPISWLDGQESTTPIVMTEDSKELGESIAEYAIVLNQESAAAESERYLYPLRGLEPKGNSIPGSIFVQNSFFTFDNEQIMLSACKHHRSEAGTIVRFYNRSPQLQELWIQTMLQIAECTLCSLLEEPVDLIAGVSETFFFQENKIHLQVPAKKIITLHIRWR